MALAQGNRPCLCHTVCQVLERISHFPPCPFTLRVETEAAVPGAPPCLQDPVCFLLTDAAPLSAPAFSLVFPFLKMVLTDMPHQSEEEEERVAQILQILTVHAQLRASPTSPPGRMDEVGRGAGAGRQRLWVVLACAQSGGVVECVRTPAAALGLHGAAARASEMPISLLC